MTALLDTHVLIWWLNDSNRLSPAQQEVVASASAESPLLVSDISLWEVATLHSLGRIQLTIPLRAWLDKAAAPPLVRRHGISPAIAAELATLPDWGAAPATAPSWAHLVFSFSLRSTSSPSVTPRSRDRSSAAGPCPVSASPAGSRSRSVRLPRPQRIAGCRR